MKSTERIPFLHLEHVSTAFSDLPDVFTHAILNDFVRNNFSAMNNLSTPNTLK